MKRKIRSCLRYIFKFKIKAAVKFKPEEYIWYFEDLGFAPNAEIGLKDISEAASNR